MQRSTSPSEESDEFEDEFDVEFDENDFKVTGALLGSYELDHFILNRELQLMGGFPEPLSIISDGSNRSLASPRDLEVPNLGFSAINPTRRCALVIKPRIRYILKIHR